LKISVHREENFALPIVESVVFKVLANKGQQRHCIGLRGWFDGRQCNNRGPKLKPGLQSRRGSGVVAQGPKRRTDAKALGLGYQVGKVASRILSGLAATICTNSTSISDEEVGPR